MCIWRKRPSNTVQEGWCRLLRPRQEHQIATIFHPYTYCGEGALETTANEMLHNFFLSQDYSFSDQTRAFLFPNNTVQNRVLEMERQTTYCKRIFHTTVPKHACKYWTIRFNATPAAHDITLIHHLCIETASREAWKGPNLFQKLHYSNHCF